MKLYQYPKCSTCRRAEKFLNERGVSFTSIDLTEQPPTRDELECMLTSYAGNIRKLFNTSGMQYRDLKMKDRLPTMTDQEAIELLAENGMLIKRPFLLKRNGQGLVGFKSDDWKEFI